MTRPMHFIGSASVGITHAGKCLAHLFHAAANARQRTENRLGIRTIGLEMRFTFGCDVVQLPRSLLFHVGVSDFMEIGQSRINHTRTRRIESARTFFESLDKFIPVCWMLGQQCQDDELNVDCVQFASTRKVAAGKVAHKARTTTAESTALAVMTAVFAAKAIETR